jgi:uncharacterized alpha-E superfamily protein
MTPQRTVLHVIDNDDGATGMDIVRVPEGFSFQIFDRRVANEYQSVIANIDTAREVANFIRDHVGL